MKPCYSGKDSATFWKVVNGLKDDADRASCYSLGVALQNLEEFVLRQLANAVGKQEWRRRRKGRGK